MIFYTFRDFLRKNPIQTLDFAKVEPAACKGSRSSDSAASGRERLTR